MPVVALGHDRVNAIGWGFDSYSRKLNILYFHSSLWCRGNNATLTEPLNTQCLQNSAENGEWSVLTLGSLSCYLRDTA